MQVEQTQTRAAMNSSKPPLVLDLDGTLLRTDTLIESALLLVRRQPLMLFLLLRWALAGPLTLKARLAERVQLDMAALPWREDLLAWVGEQRAQGRRVLLATAAHRSIADAAAAHAGPFEQVLATEGSVNLKSEAKLAAIRAAVGPDFVYAGDSSADLPVWRAGSAAVLAGVKPGLRAQLGSQVPIEAEFGQTSAGLMVWLRAIRMHQWAKNLLIFVPLFTAFAYAAPGKLWAAFLVFVAFSLAASGTYLMNDLWDLSNDRRHPRKKLRALASGQIATLHGVAAAAVLLAAGMAVALWVGWPSAAMLAAYVVVTTAYSWVLKTYVLIDVVVLAVLYSHRVLAGSVATDIPVSPWLLAFSIFTFMSLALVKRCGELVALQQAGRESAVGRDYRVGDLVVLWPFGAAASVCATVVFGLYAAAPETAARFAHPRVLWLMAVALIYWFGRLWIKTARGEMHDDPLVFALRDRGSRVTMALMGVVFVAAYGRF